MAAPGPLEAWRARVAAGDIEADPQQEAAARRLDALHRALKRWKPGARSGGFLGIGGRPAAPPRGLYLHGRVGRGKSMLMDLFFAGAPVRHKTRIHFNAFMLEAHSRIADWRKLDARARARHAHAVSGAGDDPIAPVARGLAAEARLLCFDEFQVTDIADAMILGRLFERLFEEGVVVVATSNTPPDALYEGGLNRGLFLPFIALLTARMDVLALDGGTDYRTVDGGDARAWVHPLGGDADAAMDAAFAMLSGGAEPAPVSLTVQGRRFDIPRAAGGVARLGFAELCEAPRAAADYLALARAFDALVLDHVPVLSPEQRNAARRFVLLIDTLYDERVRLDASADGPPEAIYRTGDGAEAFARTVSRLTEMRTPAWIARSKAGR